jgi:hypothetical protein
LNFRDKGSVALEPTGDGTTVTLNATTAARGLKLFQVHPLGKNDTVTIAASTSVGVGALFNPQAPATPNGTETVSFFVRPRHRSVGLSSTVSWTGFDSVGLS